MTTDRWRAGAGSRARIAIVGPTHPYKGGVAQHTTELAHRLAARGHDVRIESWSAQYPARLYPGQQRVSDPETEPFPATSYPLSWRRPDSWLRLGRRLRSGVDAVVVVMITPIQAPAYLGILAGLRPAENSVAALRPAGPRPGGAPAAGPWPVEDGLAGLRSGDVPGGPRPAEDSLAAIRGPRG
ncbi:glycosyltransferase family 4 protein, partial [Candidatus Protofrankia californiensis]|uniref:glycosyltransferase family 4 protein n=1 Tax=Candidatus Protofrankia californiensis TaxID=1839754 RepID=UPI001F495F85